jgi:hypothetical protein
MHSKLGKLLACPVCSACLFFEGTMRGNRYVSGYFKCPSGHVFQVKEQIGLLKDAKLSEKEFEWKVNVADEKKYLEVRRQYDSYLRDDQKAATREMMEKLADCVSRSSFQSDNTVLDVASGMGTFLLPLLDECSADSVLVGTDIDERALRGLMNRSLKAGTYDRLSLVVTDAKHLCFKNAVFSTVSSFLVLTMCLRQCWRSGNVPEFCALAARRSSFLYGTGKGQRACGSLRNTTSGRLRVKDD